MRTLFMLASTFATFRAVKCIKLWRIAVKVVSRQHVLQASSGDSRLYLEIEQYMFNDI